MKRSLLAPIFASALVLLQACSTFAPSPSKQEINEAAIGTRSDTILGAVLAYLGDQYKDRYQRNQVILAAAGGDKAILGGVDYYMSLQETRLSKLLRGTGVRLERLGNAISLIMPSHIVFTIDSSDISTQFYPVLHSVAMVIAEYDKTLVVVAGHTDRDCGAGCSLALSLEWARSISGYLMSKDIFADRLEPTGFGERHPIASNDSEEGKRLNRRVEITLLPIDGS
ncbi:MAG: OmpA family protein [Porticoccaceae bacterium]|nr:OmpA family protein [Porticoccaceae bacterium]MDG1308591.1 OmpA family protein [Porticoccaceae bacterium]